MGICLTKSLLLIAVNLIARIAHDKQTNTCCTQVTSHHKCLCALKQKMWAKMIHALCTAGHITEVCTCNLLLNMSVYTPGRPKWSARWLKLSKPEILTVCKSALHSHHIASISCRSSDLHASIVCVSWHASRADSTALQGMSDVAASISSADGMTAATICSNLAEAAVIPWLQNSGQRCCCGQITNPALVVYLQHDKSCAYDAV